MTELDVPFPIDSTLFELVSVAVEDAITFVLRVKDSRSPRWHYRDWPQLSLTEDGFPSVMRTDTDGPLDYKKGLMGFDLVFDIFGGESQGRFNYENRPVVRAVIEYIKKNTNLKRRFFPDQAEWGIAMYEFRIWKFIANLVDRYLNKYPAGSLSQDLLMSEYLPLEEGHLADELTADLYIPIPYARFKLERIDFLDDALITVIPPKVQLGRLLPAKSDYLTERATHAFVLKSFVFRPGDRNIHDFIADERSYPMDQIDLFLSVFRNTVDPDSGYCQIVTVPDGWALDYTATELPMEIISVQRYTSDLARRAWSDSIPEVDADQLNALGERYIKAAKLIRGEFRRRVGVAIRRFTMSRLRENEDDAVVDASIALEALFCGGEKEEITRTLSTRLAALSTLDPSFAEEAADVYQNCKRVYSLRSRIVHGDDQGKIEKGRTITRGNSIQSTLSVAQEYIALALRVLAEHPRYLESALIDSELLFRPRGQPQSDDGSISPPKD